MARSVGLSFQTYPQMAGSQAKAARSHQTLPETESAKRALNSSRLRLLKEIPSPGKLSPFSAPAISTIASQGGPIYAERLQDNTLILQDQEYHGEDFLVELKPDQSIGRLVINGKEIKDPNVKTQSKTLQYIRRVVDLYFQSANKTASAQSAAPLESSGGLVTDPLAELEILREIESKNASNQASSSQASQVSGEDDEPTIPPYFFDYLSLRSSVKIAQQIAPVLQQQINEQAPKLVKELGNPNIQAEANRTLDRLNQNLAIMRGELERFNFPSGNEYSNFYNLSTLPANAKDLRERLKAITNRYNALKQAVPEAEILNREILEGLKGNVEQLNGAYMLTGKLVGEY